MASTCSASKGNSAYEDPPPKSTITGKKISNFIWVQNAAIRVRGGPPVDDLVDRFRLLLGVLQPQGEFHQGKPG
jgi:hypothetical protein